MMPISISSQENSKTRQSMSHLKICSMPHFYFYRFISTQSPRSPTFPPLRILKSDATGPIYFPNTTRTHTQCRDLPVPTQGESHFPSRLSQCEAPPTSFPPPLVRGVSFDTTRPPRWIRSMVCWTSSMGSGTGWGGDWRGNFPCAPDAGDLSDIAEMWTQEEIIGIFHETIFHLKEFQNLYLSSGQSILIFLQYFSSKFQNQNNAFHELLSWIQWFRF